MKVALLSARSGYIQRGVEKWSCELYRRLPFEVRVFSLAETDWTTRVRGVKRTDPEYARYLKFYEILEGVRKRHRFFRRASSFVTNLVPYNTSWLSEGDGEVLSYAWYLTEALEAFRPDLIINHMGGTLGIVLRRYRKKHRIPFMAVGGSGIGKGEYRNASTMPDAYVAQTPANRMFIAQTVPGLRVELIPNGFDVTEFVQSDRVFSAAELGERNRLGAVDWQHPFILSTSHFDAHKRLDRLIDAVAAMPRGTLIFTGDGTARDELLKRAGDKLPGRFAWFGVLPWEEMPTLYRTADVFCLTSVAEPFGGVFVEAMGANTPVVAHRDMDREWLVGENGGVLTDVLSPAALTAALTQAAEKDWQDGPRRQALQLFDWDVIAGQYARVISDIVSLYRLPPHRLLPTDE